MTKMRRDVLSKAQRSYCMSCVKSKNTKIEMVIRSALFKKGYRFRIHVSSLPGKPDIVFPSKKLCIQINGEFWHGKNFGKWKDKLNPYWKKKILKNIARDKKNYQKLRRQGWSVINIWEKNAYRDLEKELSKIIKKLNE